MTANRKAIHRPADPPGVSYDGGDGVYMVYLHGRRVGSVISGYQCWTARPINAQGWASNHWAWTAPTRRQATAGLIAWLEERP